MNQTVDTLRRDPRSHGLWACSADPPPATPALEGDETADALVVGAGFTGLAAALTLAQRGISVRVLEARDIGYGASGRNVGLVNAGLWLSPREIADRLGTNWGERLLATLGEAPARVFELIEQHNMQCEAARPGTLHCAHSRRGFEDLRQRAEHWAARGAPVELLDARATRDKTGSSSFHGALLDHRAGTIQPLGYARGLAQAAINAGARVHSHSPVASLDRVGSGWRARTGAGSATAERVILATNAYTESILPIAECVVPFSFFQVSTPPLPAHIRASILPEGHGSWDTAKILTSLRVDRDGRLVAGSMGRLDARQQGIHAHWLQRRIRRVFPQLEQVSLEHGWHGLIATTPDHLPRLCCPGEGLITAYGYNGRGIGTGTVFGQAMADFVIDNDPAAMPLPLTPMKRAPFRGARALGIELAVTASHWISDRF